MAMGSDDLRMGYGRNWVDPDGRTDLAGQRTGSAAIPEQIQQASIHAATIADHSMLDAL